MAKNGCGTCLKITLFILNLFFCLCGLALIAVSLWAYYDPKFETELKQELTKDNIDYAKQGFTGVVWFLVGVGVFIFIIGLIGCIGACLESRCLLGFYFTIILILFLIGLGVGIFVLVCRAQIRTKFYEAVQTVYTDNAGNMDTVEKRFNCCGYGNSTMPQPATCVGQIKPPCTETLWDHLDQILMISGIVLLVVLVLMALAMILSCVLCAAVRYEGYD